MFEKVENIVCGYIGGTPEEMRSKGRKMINADSRHFVWFILHNVMGYKVEYIAKEYKVTRRNVYHAINKIYDGIRLQPFYAKHYKCIKDELKAQNIIN